MSEPLTPWAGQPAERKNVIKFYTQCATQSCRRPYSVVFDVSGREVDALREEAIRMYRALAAQGCVQCGKSEFDALKESSEVIAHPTLFLTHAVVSDPEHLPVGPNYNPGGILWGLLTHLPGMADKDRQGMRELREYVENAIQQAWPGGTPSKAGLDVVTTLLWATSTVLELRQALRNLQVHIAERLP